MNNVPKALTSTALTSQPNFNTIELHNRDLTMNIESETTDVMDISYEDELNSFDEELANLNSINHIYVESEDKMETSMCISTSVPTGNKSSSDLENLILKDTNIEGLSSENSALIDHNITDVQTPPVTPIPKLVQILLTKMNDVPTASTSAASTSQTSPNTFCSHNIDLAMDIKVATTDIIGMLSDDGSNVESPDLELIHWEYYEKYIKKKKTSLSFTPSTASIEEKSSFDSGNSILKVSSIEDGSSENSVLFDESTDEQISPVAHILNFVQVNQVGLETMNIEEHLKRLKILEKELEFIEETEWMFQSIDLSIRL